MAARRLAMLRYGALVAHLIALAGCVWAFVAGVEFLGQSLVGGLAVMLIAVLLATGVSWRIQFTWRRIHRDS